MTIRGKAARLHDRPGRAKVRRVYAERDVAIPPASVMDVPVIVTRPTLRQVGEQWAIQPKRLGDGIMGARTLIAEAADKALVRVMNLSESKCTVHRGRLIGEAEAALLCDFEG